MIKRGLVVVAVGAVGVVLAIGGASEPAESAEANVAPCAPGVTTAGTAPVAWGPQTVATGPVAVDRQPLERMFEAKNGWLYAKMPLRVAGHRYVIVSVPAELRKRVFLYYGRIHDAEGHATTSFFAAPGYGETEFRPCHDRPRTAWTGGLRVKGRAPVALEVTIEGDRHTLRLPLGRPKPYTAPSP